MLSSLYFNLYYKVNEEFENLPDTSWKLNKPFNYFYIIKSSIINKGI